MFRVSIIILFLSSSAFAKTPDYKGVLTFIEKVKVEMNKSQTFTDKFRYVKVIREKIDKEVSLIKDSEYDQNMDTIFDLNFISGALTSFETPFPKTECSFQKKKLIRNFSDYKTDKIHPKLEQLSKIPLNLFQTLCGI